MAENPGHALRGIEAPRRVHNVKKPWNGNDPGYHYPRMLWQYIVVGGSSLWKHIPDEAAEVKRNAYKETKRSYNAIQRTAHPTSQSFTLSPLPLSVSRLRFSLGLAAQPVKSYEYLLEFKVEVLEPRILNDLLRETHGGAHKEAQIKAGGSNSTSLWWWVVLGGLIDQRSIKFSKLGGESVGSTDLGLLNEKNFICRLYSTDQKEPKLKSNVEGGNDGLEVEQV
ncbi:hypothetical protein DFH08DRAFT_1036023 [Mycena albidolilacea]|uniref:Uncharacterized protein n=1 Tax=Mycena albidolilacea TaxID=1033008 RepID=A0AAD6ZE90_9AGAR|nr:hypothetical protein DFH08DRAFT_1036023 [Mycena albidolilacea]